MWKYPLAVSSSPQTLGMPAQSDIRHVHSQVIAGRDYVVFWAEVDPSAPMVSRTFRIFATGEPIHLPVYSYIGTAHVPMAGGEFVWHVYEDKRP